jgi:hypothetical protein
MAFALHGHVSRAVERKLVTSRGATSILEAEYVALRTTPASAGKLYPREVGANLRIRR